MINYELKRVSENSPFYNIIFYKNVNKRDGSVEAKANSKIYGIKFDRAINILSHYEAQDNLGDKDVSLKEYLIELRKSWNKIYNENC